MSDKKNLTFQGEELISSFKKLEDNFIQDLNTVIQDTKNIVKNQKIDDVDVGKIFKEYIRLFWEWVKDKDNETAKVKVIQKYLDKDSQKEITKTKYRFANLKEGLALLEGFREFLSGQKIFYIIASQIEDDDGKLLFAEEKQLGLIDGLDFYNALGEGTSQLDISLAKARTVNAEILKAEKGLSEIEEIASHINEFQKYVYETGERPTTYTTYWEKKKQNIQNKTINSQPYLVVSDKERWKIWTEEKSHKQLKQIIKQRGLKGLKYNEYFGSEKYYKYQEEALNAEKYYTKRDLKENKYFLLSLDSQGKIFEAILHGASYYSYKGNFQGIDIDKIAIEAVQHDPFYASADVYIKLKKETSIGLQAKAIGASVHGDSIYNAISDIIKQFPEGKIDKINDKLEDYLRKKFLQSSSKEIQDEEREWFGNIINSLKKQL